MNHSNKMHKKRKYEKGQISIFFSTVILVLITFMAFIINIGIFVKAKINLQNATDAAAYAGASVQARQLTNIAFLNWEMRNIYKEWMFKYYVLGGLALPKVSGDNAGGFMDFTMESYTRTQTAAKDLYNFPSICMDFSSTGGVGMCTKYLVPGLPRFESSNVLGMDETTNAFIDTIVSKKAKNCSERTALNYYTANTWAYNVKTNDASVSNITAQAPEIAASFMGAFPAAFELGVRMRNLEFEVNTPPQGSICVNPADGVDCTVDASSLSTPGHERALKAWTSGFRNMGKNGNDGADNRFKNSFTLKEVAPKVDTSINIEGSLSTILMPKGSHQKHYLDLKLMTVNYATFYTGFTGGQGNIMVDGQRIESEGQCNATKIGLPIPGYPVGFVKNPNILTYYAVEGKAKFTGLFNPFDSEIVLSAYAAAKPFGGRIGPALFNISDPQKIISRDDRKSSAFITALNTASFRGTFGGGASGEYAPGMPVPINIDTTGEKKFWMTSESDHVGGWIQGPQIYYGIPNMIWDYPNGNFGINQSFLAEQKLEIIRRAGDGAGGNFTPQAGLYNEEMFERLKKYLVGIGGVVTSENIDNGIIMARAPTLYDAHNYLIPTPETLNKNLKLDSWGAIESEVRKNLSNGSENFEVYDLSLYAPLFSPNALFKTSGDVVSTYRDYVFRQEAAIRKYQSSMNLVAADIFNNNTSQQTGQNTGEEAAKVLSDLEDTQYAGIKNGSIEPSDSDLKPSCSSISGKFLYFYTGNAEYIDEPDIIANCATPLIELLRTRWSDSSLTNEIYNIEYAISQNMREQLFSAYRPGPLHGASGTQGVQVNPLNNRDQKMIRNFYSAKFIPIKGVSSSPAATYSQGKMNIYSEGDDTTATNGVNRSSFSNSIDESELTIDINSASH